MFDSIRKHQRLLLLFVVVLIMPAFVFWGISGYDRALSGNSDVASVEGTPITEQAFAQAQRQQLDNLRQMLGDGVDPRMFDTPEARSEVLEGLITRRVAAHEARQSRIIVTDLQLRDSILAIPGLRSEDGRFDEERYQSLLRSQNLTAAGFESMLRDDLALQALPESVGGSALISKTVLDRMLALQQERREVREQRFAPQAYIASVKPTEEELKRFHEENARLFEAPEQARVEYTVLSRESLAAQVKPNSDELRAYYEQNVARYGSPEERRASHVLVKAGPESPAKAEKLLARLKRSPGEFAAVAKAESDDPGSAGQGGDLGYFERNAMVKPFADAAFEMKQDEIRGPIETEFGLHIIRLTGVRPATTKSFEQVRPQIETEFRMQQAAQRFAEAAESFTNTIYEQSDTLKPAADRFDLQIRTATLTGRVPDAAVEPNSPLGNPRLLTALFSDEVLKNKRNTEAVEVAPGRLAAARIVEYQPPRSRPFAEVQDEVRARFIARRAAQLAREAGEARLEVLRKNGAAVAGQGFGDARVLQRGAPSDLPPQAVEAVFRLSAGELPRFAGVDRGEQGYSIYQLGKVTPATPQEIAQRRAAFETQLVRVVSQQDLAAYLEAIKQRAKIVRHPERLTSSPDRP